MPATTPSHISSLPSSPIGPAQAELITGRTSMIVASRDAQLRPHVMRAVGCRLSDDRRRLTVLLPEEGGSEVLQDLRANQQIAVVFSRPSSNRTIQLKGHDATITPSGPDDQLLAERYLQGFIAEIGALGHPAEVAQTILGYDGALMQVHFTVGAAFEQTPGPGAGQPLPAAAA